MNELIKSILNDIKELSKIFSILLGVMILGTLAFGIIYFLFYDQPTDQFLWKDLPIYTFRIFSRLIYSVGLPAYVICLYRPWRHISCSIMSIISFIIGLQVWMFSTWYAFRLSPIGAILAMLFMGVGTVLYSCLWSLFNGDLETTGYILLGIFLIFLTRIITFSTVEKTN